ncbi:MAG: cupin domain-containing protein [Candidatus Eremiobacteraeota bacterium]|nr:cupin domain-containing protein [Candidatus Eremiobacteraeota bacterium]
MIRPLVLVAAAAFAVALPAAADPAAGAFIVMPAQLHWQSSNELPPGAKMAVLDGDPSKTGWYTIRISAPAGLVSAVHYHGGTEYLTVLSGTIELGTGKAVNMAMVTLPAGSYVEIPAGVHHVVKMKTAAVVQVSGNGPMTTTNVK